ncbi:MAG: hypothetical protein AUI14_02750 [Actinobacteria bacterium 13_2_20CM_2_71_6]|nr:MAG: hypothetical protein AUI14_02750 [Actinobacteria bacterium 13_2_20CM_2_71_6]
MSLTGLPLLVLSIVASAGAFVLTIWSWQRGGPWRVVVRTLGVLLCEALVLFSTGLVVNRALGDLFPSWSALLNQDRAAPPPTVVAAPATKLDAWLHGRAVEGAHNGLVFEWKPTGEAGWHLSAPPVIYVPPEYFSATSAHFPVVLVVAPAKSGPAQGAWDPNKINLLVPRGNDDATPAVIVFLRTDHPDEPLLSRVLPKFLDGDLRTAARGWGVIGIGSDAAVGLDVLTEEPLRFWSAVAVADATGDLPKAVTKARAYLEWQAALTIAPGAAGKNQPGQSRVEVVARVDARLPAALRWVYGLLPAPLTAPVTGPVDPNAPPPTKKPGG